MTRSFKRIGIVVLAAASLVLGSAPAPAQGKPDVGFLASKLKADDFRVRTNAALALGAVTGDDAPKVVQPLCEALADSSDVVRHAVAVALKRQGRASALPCLKGRLGAEGTDAVKLQITRAIEAIEAGGGGGTPAGAEPAPSGDAPKVNPNAKYYVAFTVGNRSTRSDAPQLVSRALQSKIDSTASFQRATPNESTDAAKAAVGNRKLKGVHLRMNIRSVEYVEDPANGLLVRVVMGASVETYPGLSIKGELEKKVAVGVRARGDKAAEDQALTIAAGAVVDQFAQNASAFLQ
jgi:hypothetical protein